MIETKQQYPYQAAVFFLLCNIIDVVIQMLLRMEMPLIPFDVVLFCYFV